MATCIKKRVLAVLSPQRFQWTFVLGFWIGRNQIDGEFFSGVMDFCLERMEFFLLDRFWVIVMGVLDVGLHFAYCGFFFFFLIVMIFDKPHGGGWVLMGVRQNVGFGGCSRCWGWF